MDEQQGDIEFGFKRPRGGNLTIEEDVLLIQSWVSTSTNPVHGTEQSKKAYWMRIWGKSNEYKGFDTIMSHTSLANQWGVIRKSVTQFAANLAQVELLNQRVSNPYFVQSRNCSGTLDLSSLQKITVTFTMITYGVLADYVDEYVRIGETTATESLQNFVEAVVSIYSNTYLRSPNKDDVARLLEVGENRSFPRMLGSIDCMHRQWKNCPAAWKDMFSSRRHEPTTILEGVASQDLWVWHAFFGLPGSNNDINVLEQSSMLSEFAEGCAPPANYSINGHNYKMRYYLANGIYLQWSTFVKTISCPQGKKAKQFAAAQESTRKDMERAFGVLQAQFAIICGPTHGWNR
ncbi:uncharacterized protein LOC132185204 [Corylus avellana]|uniref:uncharacterized protein LOC132185204 n=1 Tax=Corylus avellana TaxID=13451 RepID=UPI00286A9B37|nr:uncharacterized protein LOC132185204 [Corylus avellana]